MECRIYRKNEYKQSGWAGGVQEEIAVFPAGASYLRRDFIWRLGLWHAEKEEALLPRLEDYERTVLILEGEAVLGYEGQRVARMKSLEQDRFEGRWKTRVYGAASGAISAFDLSVRQGAEGYIDLIFPQETAADCPVSEHEAGSLAACALFCYEGYAVIETAAGSHMIKPGDVLVLQGEAEEISSCRAMGEGVLVRAQIFYDDMNSSLGPQIIPPAKPTFDDFKLCVFLANTQFRFARAFIKRLRTTWYDEALSGAINKIERTYLPFIIFMIGLTATSVAGVSGGWPGPHLAAAIAAWILTDCLLVSPLIYFAVLPKPVRRHIKSVDELTPYELKAREAELGSNPRTEAILRKYKNSGKTGEEDTK